MVFLFLIFMLASLASYGMVVYRSWINSVRKTIASQALDVNSHISSQIESFLHVPLHVNEVNHLVIQNQILDLQNEQLRDKFFAGVLQAHDQRLYSFSYGMADGSYYGARHNEQGAIEVMRNNTTTGGQSWYYHIKEDMTAGELAVKAGLFDPRTRDWYKAAAAARKPVYAPVYKHFVMDDLTVSAAWPIFDETGELTGVLGAHLLLTDINGYLESALTPHRGYAVLLEKATGHLIGHSLGDGIFRDHPDETLGRQELADIQNVDIIGAFQQYEADQISQFRYKGDQNILYVNVQPIQDNGIDWILISALPEAAFTADITASMLRAAALAAFVLIMLILIYILVIRRLLNPVSSLYEASSALMAGDWSQRVEIVRNDEIGMISESFNNVAARIQTLVEHLEENVRTRTKELHAANVALTESREELRLILDTAAEAVYGIDLHGCCTFCNASGLKMLGYSREQELIGKDMHRLIHHSMPDGSSFPLSECRIFQSIRLGRGFTADDEVFWRSDGTPFAVEYRAFPQMRDGSIVGGVITFMDITDRKRREDEIRFLSQHDPLTGLYNRRSFESALEQLSSEDNLPLSVIFADINGLKITNDLFGHAAGDALILSAASVLARTCRIGDVIARIGGDEFVILLPKTTPATAHDILNKIKTALDQERVSAIKCSAALGTDTKMNRGQPLAEVIANAENRMYQDKTINRKKINKVIIDTIMATLHEKNPRERQHATVVKALCGRFGALRSMPALEIEKLKRAAYLHDIGKITLDEALLADDSFTDEEEYEPMQQHALTGYRLLNQIDETMDLADIIYNHHEHWDGRGYPRGLKGEQIPESSRIIAVVETYERVLNRTSSLNKYSQAERKEQAIAAIRHGAGTRFDPGMIELFIQMINQDLV